MSKKKYKRKFFDPRYVPHERRQHLVLACILFCSVAAFFIIRHFVFMSVEVKGTSMMPVLWEGDDRLAQRWIYYARAPRRGEVVVIEHPGEKSFSVKRVIGLPGEEIDLRGGRVYVNGNLLEENYLKPDVRTFAKKKDDSVRKLDAESFFLLGDNRGASEDSRNFGPLSRKKIIAKVNL